MTVYISRRVLTIENITPTYPPKKLPNSDARVELISKHTLLDMPSQKEMTATIENGTKSIRMILLIPFSTNRLGTLNGHMLI